QATAIAATAPSAAIRARPYAAIASPATLALSGTTSISGVAAAITTQDAATTNSPAPCTSPVRRGRDQRSRNRATGRIHRTALQIFLSEAERRSSQPGNQK